MLQLLAYQTMVVREARRCGGRGWQSYNAMFRQQAAISPSVDWSKLNNSLYSTTFLQQQNGRGRICVHCMETDHGSQECALALFHATGTPRIPEASPARTMTIGPTETGGQKCAIRGTTVDAPSLTADTNISVRNAVRQRTKLCTALPTREQDQRKKGEALKSRRAWPETAWT